MRHQFSLHYALFKRVSSHMCHEGNAESTFSLSGGLSNGNKHTDPAFLSTMVRINKNKHIYDPPSDIVFKAYRSKFGKVPNEDKVEYDSEPAAADGESEESDPEGSSDGGEDFDADEE